VTGLRFHFWESQNSVKSRFGDMGFSISNSIWDLSSGFLKMSKFNELLASDSYRTSQIH